jgi:hypothetical protein
MRFYLKKMFWNATYWNEISLLILLLFSSVFLITIKIVFFSTRDWIMSRTQTLLILTKWIEVLINSFELYKNRSTHSWDFLISACLKRHDDYSMTCLNFFENVIYLSLNSFENSFFSIKTFSEWHRRLSCERTLNFAWFWIFFRRFFLSWTLKNEIWIRAKTYHSLFVNLSMNSRLISNVIRTRKVDR